MTRTYLFKLAVLNVVFVWVPLGVLVWRAMP